MVAFKIIKGVYIRNIFTIFLESYQIYLLFLLVFSFLSNSNRKIGKSESFACRGGEVRKKGVKVCFFQMFPIKLE